MRKRSVAILVFDDAEVLDFAGPFEVFAVTSELNDHALFDVQLVGMTEAAITAVNGMRVLPNRACADVPAPDVLVIAGGVGTRRVMNDARTLEWIRRAAGNAEIVLSVCSGARLLGTAGLLDGLDVTTHHDVFEHLEQIAPAANVKRGPRFIDTGRIITTGGISAGIDGAFHVVARLLGRGIAERTAAYMEYAWTPEPSHAPHYKA